MKDVIVYEMKDGSVGIMTASPEWQGTLDELAFRDVPTGCPFQVVAAESLPAQRFFRDTWMIDVNTGNVVESLPKARDMFMALIREARNKKLAELDVETIKATGAGDQTRLAAVEAEKEALRDLPESVSPALKMADSIEELCICWPALLADRKPVIE